MPANKLLDTYCNDTGRRRRRRCHRHTDRRGDRLKYHFDTVIHCAKDHFNMNRCSFHSEIYCEDMLFIPGACMFLIFFIWFYFFLTNIKKCKHSVDNAHTFHWRFWLRWKMSKEQEKKKKKTQKHNVGYVRRYRCGRAIAMRTFTYIFRLRQS